MVETTTSQSWLSSLVYENKDSEKAYEIFEKNQPNYGSEYEWISKADFMKSFGQELAQENHQGKETLPEPNFRQPENAPTPDSYSDLSNQIEYDGFQHEIQIPKPEKTDFRQPESPSVQQTPSASVPERPTLEQEKTEANTGLDYDVPKHLKSRMVVVETQRFRVAGYEMGAHSLRYTAPDNPKTVLFEDKGKTIQTARDDKQTIQDMLDVAKAKGWDSIKISGSQEFKRKMWLEAESRGIATKGYKPSPEDLAILENRREERATNNIAEAEKLKQQSAVPESRGIATKTIPQEAVKAADTVQALATQAQQTHTPKPSDTAKTQYESKLATLPAAQQHKARFYERQALAAMQHMPAEFHEKTRQAIYENQSDLIRDGKYHAIDPMKSVDRQPEKAQDKTNERVPSRDDGWEMER